MKKNESTLSNFVMKLDAKILSDQEAVLLKGGFVPVSNTDGTTDTLCNVDNCPCPITNNRC